MGHARDVEGSERLTMIQSATPMKSWRTPTSVGARFFVEGASSNCG